MKSNELIIGDLYKLQYPKALYPTSSFKKRNFMNFKHEQTSMGMVQNLHFTKETVGLLIDVDYEIDECALLFAQDYKYTIIYVNKNFIIPV